MRRRAFQRAEECLGTEVVPLGRDFDTLHFFTPSLFASGVASVPRGGSSTRASAGPSLLRFFFFHVGRSIGSGLPPCLASAQAFGSEVVGSAETSSRSCLQRLVLLFSLW